MPAPSFIPEKKSQRPRTEDFPQKRSALRWPLIFLISIILSVGLLYGLLSVISERLNSQIKDQKEALNNAEQRIKGEFAKNIRQVESKLSLLEKLIDSHILWTALFALLEDETLEKVQFESFNASLKEKKIKLSGLTQDFGYLASQVLQLRESKKIKNVAFSGLAMTELGLKFVLSIELYPEAWKSE